MNGNLEKLTYNTLVCVISHTFICREIVKLKLFTLLGIPMLSQPGLLPTTGKYDNLLQIKQGLQAYASPESACHHRSKLNSEKRFLDLFQR